MIWRIDPCGFMKIGLDARCAFRNNSNWNEMK